VSARCIAAGIRAYAALSFFALVTTGLPAHTYPPITLMPVTECACRAEALTQLSYPDRMQVSGSAQSGVGTEAGPSLHPHATQGHGTFI